MDSLSNNSAGKKRLAFGEALRYPRPGGKMMYAVIAIAGAVLLLVLVVSALLSLKVSDLPRVDREAELRKETEKGYIDLDAWNGLAKKEFCFDSPRGYRLEGIRVQTPTPAFSADGKRLRRVMVFCHGHGYCLVGSIKYIDRFLALGYDAVLYDHRASGRSGGTHIGMGFFEKEDLAALLALLRAEYGSGALIGTHGESMGGATVLLQAAMSDPPDFVIADCPFSDLRQELAYRLKIENRLPAFPFVALASLITRLRAGYFYGQVSPLREIAAHDGLAAVPVLFMHGGSDAYIPNGMSRRLFEAKKGITDFCIVEGAGHGASVVTDRVLYEKTVDRFLSRI